MRLSPRVLLVTLGLALAGSVFGAAVAAASLAVGILVTTASLGPHDVIALTPTAMIGGVIGALVGPTAGWLLLRHVPLGAAVTWTAVGAFLGGVIGWVVGWVFQSTLNEHVPSLGDAIGLAPIAALGGFVIAALVLRRRASEPSFTPFGTTRPPHN